MIKVECTSVTQQTSVLILQKWTIFQKENSEMRVKEEIRQKLNRKRKLAAQRLVIVLKVCVRITPNLTTMAH